MASSLIAFSWAASTFWAFCYGRTFSTKTTCCRAYCVLGGGTFFVQHDHMNSPVPFDTAVLPESLALRRVPRYRTLRWRPAWVHNGTTFAGSGTYDQLQIQLPLWMPFLLLVMPTVILFWLDRARPPSHCCQGCGYDLTANVSGTCPECGQTAEGKDSSTTEITKGTKED
jgi:hypothetical protein